MELLIAKLMKDYSPSLIAIPFPPSSHISTFEKPILRLVDATGNKLKGKP